MEKVQPMLGRALFLSRLALAFLQPGTVGVASACGRLERDRQQDRKCGTMTHFALNSHLTAMRFDGSLHDR